jgi:uncharacterized membrane protein
MEPLTIFLHWNCFGPEHGWYWPFSLFMLFGFIMMCFLFRGRRRRPFSCWWPGWSDYRYNEKSEAKDILKKRYAKGDLGKTEYERMLKEIS